MNNGTTYQQDQLEFEGESMTNEDIKAFAMELLHADSEDKVIGILKGAGYWDNHDAWRLYGDKEGNFAQVGNQQSYPEAALVEKIINSVDSRLLSKCLEQNIDPIGPEAPTSVRDAVAMFFEGRRVTDDEAGTLSTWPKKQRISESHNITLAATGDKPTRGKRMKKMCLTVCDQGEGQTPQRLPMTILSLNAKNKQRIRFVQGKFNMGGSGALRFCGDHGIQLVISKRDPKLPVATDVEDPTIDRWGVTVVRREEPSNKSGDPVHSEFTYLAPIGSSDNPREGEALSFESEKLALMPIHNEAYAREVEFGTAIKLYEYETSVGQSNVVYPDGLLYALERLLPEIALPIRLHECREGYKGEKEKSFATTLSGLKLRLESGKGGNLEPGFPLTVDLYAGGIKMTARIYAFKQDRAGTYLKDEGVIFQINGKAHGYIKKSIFSRSRSVGLPRLRDSLLVIVNCSLLSATQREDLFMSSRDRLSEKLIRREIEAEIMEMLRTHSVLRKLQQERREQDVMSKLDDQKPLEEVLGKVLRASPTLRTLFLAGQRLSKPFAKGHQGGSGGKKGTGGGAGKNKKEEEEFYGKRHPTVFKIKDYEYGKIYHRNCENNRRCRIAFETDVENGYFDRDTDKGSFEIEVLDDDELSAPNAIFTLENGDAHLSFKLPSNAETDGSFLLQTTVNDPTLTEPFVNLIRLRVIEKVKRKGGNSKKKKKSGSGSGDEGTGIGIKLPDVILVETGDEHWEHHHFDADTACHVETDPVMVDGKLVDVHTFYVNVDNNSLLTEMKYSNQDSRVLQAKFKYGNILLGLAMLHADKGNKKGRTVDKDGPSVQDQIKSTSRAIAPVLLPMIDQLSGLDESELGDLGIVDD